MNEWVEAVPAGDFKKGRRKPATLGNGAAMDRLPPHSVEAEQGVLGCILLEPEDSILECRDKLPDPEVFYDLRHRTLFEVLLVLGEKLPAFDVLAVRAALKDAGKFDEVGGDVYLQTLMDATPSAANLDFYIAGIREAHALRLLVGLCTSVVARVYDPSQGGAVADAPSASEILEGAEADMLSLGERHSPSKVVVIREALKPVIQRLDDHHRGHKLMQGLATGFNYIDNMLCGLNDAEVVLVGGRPGLGKTSLALGMAMNVAKKNVPVGVFSLEMTTAALTTRMLFMEARASLHKFRNGFLSERDAARLMEAPTVFKGMPLYIDDTSGLTIQQLAARARRMYRKEGVRLFVIDYMQLLKPTRRFNNREQEVAEVSSGILSLAKELNVPMLVCVQLNRESAKANRAPELTDFRDSGQVEQDCHVAGILWRPDIDEDDPAETGFVERAEWLERDKPWQEQVASLRFRVCKNRNGPTGDCDLLYYKQFTRFVDGHRPNGVNKTPKKAEGEGDEI